MGQTVRRRRKAHTKFVYVDVLNGIIISFPLIRFTAALFVNTNMSNIELFETKLTDTFWFNRFRCRLLAVRLNVVEVNSHYFLFFSCLMLTIHLSVMR